MLFLGPFSVPAVPYLTNTYNLKLPIQKFTDITLHYSQIVCALLGINYYENSPPLGIGPPSPLPPSTLFFVRFLN